MDQGDFKQKGKILEIIDKNTDIDFISVNLPVEDKKS